jgi:cobalt-zinc-cadmium efflux system outer membrane protein
MRLSFSSRSTCCRRLFALFITCGATASGAQQRANAAGANILTLTAVFDSIASNNPILRAASSRTLSARGNLTTARTWTNPMIQLESERMSDQLPGMPTQRETMTTAMIPLEPIYQRGPRIRSAGALVRASEADVLARRQDVAVMAAEAFYRVALAQVNVDAAQTLAQLFDSVVSYNTVRVREGVAAEADLIRSQLERDHLLNELATSESELVRARADLGAFITAIPNSVAFGVVVDSLPVYPPASLEVSTARPAAAFSAQDRKRTDSATRNRPEVIAAQERLAASEAAASIEKRMVLRELGAMVGTKTSAGSSSLVAGFSVPFPLLDQNRGGIRAARAEAEAARFEFEQQQRLAAADLAGAQDAAAILVRRLNSLQTGGKITYLYRAEEGRQIALGAYREGGTSLLQVIDAAHAWREARTSYFETLFAEHEAVIQLLVASGSDVLTAWPQLRGGGTQ